MKPMLKPSELDALLVRIDRLSPDAKPRWGRMTAGQMICHLADGLRVALGTLPARPIRTPMRYTPVKQLLIYALPWPKGRVRAPPETFTTSPAEWERDRAALRDVLTRFAGTDRERDWPDHPYFGRMSGRLWAAGQRKHFDYHLTQFGV